MTSIIKSALMTILVMGLFTILIYGASVYPLAYLSVIMTLCGTFLISLTFMTFLNRFRRNEENKKRNK